MSKAKPSKEWTNAVKLASDLGKKRKKVGAAFESPPIGDTKRTAGTAFAEKILANRPLRPPGKGVRNV